MIMLSRRFLIGDTVTFTWINSSAPSMAPSIEIYTGSETVVDVGAMVQSGTGRGHFYHFFDTTSLDSGYYVGEMIGTSGGNPFKRRVRVRLHTGGVD